jgi:hypothetical protein
MSWKTKLAAVTAGLILAAPAAAQTPATGPGTPGGTTTPGMPGPTTPSTPGSSMPGPTTPTIPGSPTPRMPGSATPGVPGSSTPGMPDPTPGVQCPPGQGRRPGSSICMPAPPGAPLPPTTR